MNTRGFSLIELLIALAICSAVTAAIAAIVQPARAAFDQVPAALDLRQRGRTAIDVLSQAMRSAGPFAGLEPAVALLDPDESGSRFSSITVTTSAVHPAQGILALDQAGPAASLVLSTLQCPDIKELCGFTEGTIAAITDGAGRFDVFEVASAHAPSRRLAPATGFASPYPQGSLVIEVTADTFRLDEQADGSFALVRETAAGAVQPIVDSVTSLAFESTHQHEVSVILTIAAQVFRASVALRGQP